MLHLVFLVSIVHYFLKSFAAWSLSNLKLGFSAYIQGPVILVHICSLSERKNLNLYASKWIASRNKRIPRFCLQMDKFFLQKKQIFI